MAKNRLVGLVHIGIMDDGDFFVYSTKAKNRNGRLVRVRDGSIIVRGREVQSKREVIRKLKGGANDGRVVRIGVAPEALRDADDILQWAIGNGAIRMAAFSTPSLKGK